MNNYYLEMEGFSIQLKHPTNSRKLQKFFGDRGVDTSTYACNGRDAYYGVLGGIFGNSPYPIGEVKTLEEMEQLFPLPKPTPKPTPEFEFGERIFVSDDNITWNERIFIAKLEQTTARNKYVCVAKTDEEMFEAGKEVDTYYYKYAKKRPFLYNVDIESDVEISPRKLEHLVILFKGLIKDYTKDYSDSKK